MKLDDKKSKVIQRATCVVKVRLLDGSLSYLPGRILGVTLQNFLRGRLRLSQVRLPVESMREHGAYIGEQGQKGESSQ